MLGRTCVRRLRTARPYVCLPCLRRQLLAPRQPGLATRDSFRVSRFHSASLLRSAASLASAPESSPPPPPPPPSSEPSAGRKTKKKTHKKQQQAQAESKQRENEEKDPTTRQSPAAETRDDEDAGPSPSHAAAANAKRLKNRRVKMKQKAKKAAEKKAVHEATEDASKPDPEIGDVLANRSADAAADGAGAAEVMAAAAFRKVNSKVRSSPKPKGETLERALRRMKKYQHPKHEYNASVSSKDVQLTPIDVEQPPIPSLAYGLDRVLFNPGVCYLQDPRSQVYNFDPYLQKVMPVENFNFDLLKRYITSSQDTALSQIACDLGKRYVGSTSSMTASLAHFHYLLSRWRRLNLRMLSKGFSQTHDTFTKINRSPSAIFLRLKDGTYAIDADKQYDTANVLSMLGKSMEKLLTLPTAEYERYRKGSPNQVTEAERDEPEAYHYTTQGDMLMRSQLDTQDPRLPGTGMFDLKTRAVVSVRMDVRDWAENAGYQIKTGIGLWESFEREYYDMMRSTMLKYSLQARMGRMNGIFVAYHNVERIFGFQYISLEEMDVAIHNPENQERHLGDHEFRLSVDLFNKALNIVTERFPDTSIRMHFEAREAAEPFMYIFAEPVPEEKIQEMQDTNRARTEVWERKLLGLEAEDSQGETRGNENKEETCMEEHSLNPESPPFDSVSTSGPFEQPGEESASSSLASHAQSQTLEGAASEDFQDTDQSATTQAAERQNPSTSEDGEEGAERRPLLCLKLFTRNKIDGQYVERPKNATADTEWVVEYQFEEVPEADAFRRYTECKNRRKAVLEDQTKYDEDEGEEVKVLNYYQKLLREMSQKGRQWREMMDEAESNRTPVVYQPLAGQAAMGETATGGAKDASAERDSPSVDSYTRWLYGRH